MRPADIIATLTLLLSLLAVLWIGVDAWILKVWALVAGVLFVLWIIGRMLAREFGLQPRPATRLPWIAGATGAFLSCTLAAGLVRVQAPLGTFVLLGALMIAAVTSLRFAYDRAKGPDANHK